MTKKNVYVILGMPRSGTSVITRALSVFDISLGEQLTKASPTWNPKGFFEDRVIVDEINRALLYHHHYHWLSLSLLKKIDFDHRNIKSLYDKAIELVKDRFSKTNDWAFKDPRTVKVLPFWQKIFEELDLQVHYIIVLRNPLSSAFSYQDLAKLPIQQGLIIWLMHLFPALSETMDQARFVIKYDALFENPEKEFMELSAFLQKPIHEEKLFTFTQKFLDKNLNHYGFSDEAFLKHESTDCVPLSRDLYQLLLLLSERKIAFNESDYINRFNTIRVEFEKYYGVYHYLDQTNKEKKQYENQLKTIARSIPYKMTYFLRRIDDWLRIKRRKKRALKRMVQYEY